MIKDRYLLFEKLDLLYGSHLINDYMYIGGCYSNSIKRHYNYLKYISLESPFLYSNLETFKLNIKNKNFKCVCGHKISQRCFIIKKNINLYDLVETDLITIGNCCIRHFYNKTYMRLCKCGVSHRNASNLCSLCYKFKKKKDKLNFSLLEYFSYKKHELFMILSNSLNKKVLFGKYKNNIFKDLILDVKYVNYIFKLINESDNNINYYADNCKITNIQNTFNFILFLKKAILDYNGLSDKFEYTNIYLNNARFLKLIIYYSDAIIKKK